MRHFAHVVFAVILVAGAPAWAGDLPKRIGYSFYVEGTRVGHSDMKVTRTPEALRFDSTTHVVLGPSTIELTSHTIADPQTYAVREFAFEGTKGGMHTAGFMKLDGDSATGWVESVASEKQHRHSTPTSGPTVVFEDWIMDLEVVMALRQGLHPEGTSEYTLLFANSFLGTDLLAGFTGEVSVESNQASLVARRITLAMSGAEPWVSMVDPATGIPVYLHFPSSHTEAFRDDFFGDDPMPRYRPTPPGGSP